MKNIILSMIIIAVGCFAVSFTTPVVTTVGTSVGVSQFNNTDDSYVAQEVFTKHKQNPVYLITGLSLLLVLWVWKKDVKNLLGAKNEKE